MDDCHGPNGNETAPVLECPDTSYCMSIYATIEDHHAESYDCDDEFVDMIMAVCQNNGNGCHKQDINQLPNSDITVCCCDSELCNNPASHRSTTSTSSTSTSSNNNQENGGDFVQFSVLAVSIVLMAMLVLSPFESSD